MATKSQKYATDPTRLREIRDTVGLTQTELGDLVGLSKEAVANHESGRRGISTRQLQKYAAALKVAPQEILKGGGKPTSDAAKLLALFEQLDTKDRKTLLAMAETFVKGRK